MIQQSRSRSPTGAAAGGRDFLEHPGRSGLEALVFWRADALARHVRVVPASERTSGDGLVRFEPARWGGRQAGRATPDGYHLIVSPSHGVEHHLFFTDPDPPPAGTKLMPMPAFDAWHPERLEATLAFWRFAHHPRVSPAPRVKPPPSGPKALETAFLIWTLDLNRAGTSDREIARAIFGEAPKEWEDSGSRSMVRRFIAKAEEFTANKYHSLLKPRRGPLSSVR
ncbi:MAG: DUF2285 domain-containing protein [Rhodopila sp.]|nr:DUF2285 domain-containing protein [Rhodopila sp.]